MSKIGLLDPWAPQFFGTSQKSQLLGTRKSTREYHAYYGPVKRVKTKPGPKKLLKKKTQKQKQIHQFSYENTIKMPQIWYQNGRTDTKISIPLVIFPDTELWVHFNEKQLFAQG